MIFLSINFRYKKLNPIIKTQEFRLKNLPRNSLCCETQNFYFNETNLIAELNFPFWHFETLKFCLLFFNSLLHTEIFFSSEIIWTANNHGWGTTIEQLWKCFPLIGFFSCLSCLVVVSRFEKKRMFTLEVLVAVQLATSIHSQIFIFLFVSFVYFFFVVFIQLMTSSTYKFNTGF